MLYFVLSLLVGSWVLEVIVETLNVRALSAKLPAEFADVFPAKKYQQSQAYLKENTRFQLLQSTITTWLLCAFIAWGGFGWIDTYSRELFDQQLLVGLMFFGVIILGLNLLSLPFQLYATFVIEEKFGFNKTTLITFIADQMKGLLMSLVIGGVVLSLVLWFFAATGSWAWFFSWIAMSLIQLFFLFIAPVVIMPLFNRFVPLKAGPLRKEIKNFATSQKFELQGIFVMDGSKRSTKANAFFTGFGRFKRIVLFDTLIDKHTTNELVAVLAHEIGHYQLGHIIKMVAFSLVSLGGLLFLANQLVYYTPLFEAFGVDTVSTHAGLAFVGVLFGPIYQALAVVSNNISRKHEFQADAYAVKTYQKPEALIEALKKLSADNLANLTPHPLKVFLEYSHPPLLQRIKAIRAVKL